MLMQPIWDGTGGSQVCKTFAWGFDTLSSHKKKQLSTIRGHIKIMDKVTPPGFKPRLQPCKSCVLNQLHYGAVRASCPIRTDVSRRSWITKPVQSTNYAKEAFEGLTGVEPASPRSVVWHIIHYAISLF